METKRVPPIRKSPYLVGGVAIALVLLLAVMAPQFWNANPSNTAVDDSAPILPSTNGPNSDQSSSGDDPLAADSPSTTHGEAVLQVAIASHLFDDSQGEAGDSAPYSDESRADEFAIGVVEKVVERGNSKHLPLKLNEVFIGRLPSGSFLAKDKMVVRMECSLPPRNLGLRSQLYKPGTIVVVYLHRNKAKRWLVTSLVPITPGSEAYWRQRLQTFADIVLAGESENSEKRFRELLVMQPNGGLENTLYNAIMIHPHPAARPVVRELWRARVKQHPVDPEESEMVGTVSLTYLMRNHNEDEMLDEVLKHAMRQKPGHRALYIWEMAVQAGYADADARNRLKAGLQKFLEDALALETLDRVKDMKIWHDVAATKRALQQLETLDSNP